MKRLKLPAYGKRLLEERSAGTHPLEVTVVYGDKWWDHDHPKICLKPEEYEPGKYDFRMLAGLHVRVLDQLVSAAEFDEQVRPPTWGKFYDLVAEIAAADTWVTVDSPRVYGQPMTLDKIASLVQWHSGIAGSGMQWPRWWNDELDAKHAHRWHQWNLHDAYERGILERERGAAA